MTVFTSLVALVSLSGIAGCSMVTFASEPKTANILLSVAGILPFAEDAPGDVLSTFNAAVLGQLLTTDSAFELKPGLITSYRWIEANSAFELRLKPNVQFHNGRKATAKDLEFALLRGFFSKRRSFYSIYLEGIQGVDKIKPDQHFSSGAVEGIKVIDDSTVRVKLKAKNPNFLYSLTNPFFSLVAPEALEPDMITWKNYPIGAGPYKVQSISKEDGIVSLKTTDPTRPGFQQVQLFTREQARLPDVSIFTTRTLSESKTLIGVLSPLPSSIVTIFFSNKNPLSTVPAFKEALHFGIDRNELTQALPAFSPTFEMLPQHFWGRAGLKNPYDPARAKEIAKKIPRALREKKWKIPVFSPPTFSSDYEIIFTRLTKQLQLIGLNFEFTPSPEKFISLETAKNSPITISGRVCDYVDPLIMFASFRKVSAFEFERPDDDKRFEELYQVASQSMSKTDRVSAMQALSRHVDEKLVALPLMERKLRLFYNPSTISKLGEQPQPLTLFIDRISGPNE